MPGLSRPLEKLFFAIPESVLIEIMPQDAGPHFGRCLCSEIFAQGEPDGVRCRAMLVRFAHAAAHRIHRLSGREVVAQRLTHFM
jgi:hypothetical protein